MTCAAGKCVVPASACAAGYAHCTANPDDGCETDITKAGHCGSCSNACGVGAPFCTATLGDGGAATYTCTSGCAPPKPTLCGSSSVDLTTDPKNCRVCDNLCTAPGGGTATCVASTCDFTCNLNFHKCGATCADNFSTSTCGTSCNACVPPANGGATCDGTTCGFNCNLNYSNCTGVCVDERNDRTNCGACGHVCGSVNGTGTCATSACAFQCSAGYKHCGATDATGCETHTDADRNNCGACGNVCPLTEPCLGGSCQCDPTKTPVQDPCVVNDTLGVFVAPTGSDNAAGTKASPFQTVGKAVTAAKAAGKRVYACAGTFAETVVINAAVDGVTIYGGLACPGGASPWSYTGAKAIVAPAVTGYALRIDALTTGVTIEDLEFDSRDGVSLGESSIAAFVTNSAAVALRRVGLKAGNGVDGAAGAWGVIWGRRLREKTRLPLANSAAVRRPVYAETGRGLPSVGGAVATTTRSVESVPRPERRTSGRGAAATARALLRPARAAEPGRRGQMGLPPESAPQATVPRALAAGRRHRVARERAAVSRKVAAAAAAVLPSR